MTNVARDLDVHIESMQLKLTQIIPLYQPGYQMLLSKWQAERTKIQHEIIALLDKKQKSNLFIDFNNWLVSLRDGEDENG